MFVVHYETYIYVYILPGIQLNSKDENEKKESERAFWTAEMPQSMFPYLSAEQLAQGEYRYLRQWRAMQLRKEAAQERWTLRRLTAV